jgi:hypothetical protein
MTFSHQDIPEFSPAFPDYYLGNNPFPPLELKEQGKQPIEVLRQTLYRREIQRLLRILMDRVRDDSAPNPWIVKDRRGGTEHNVSVIGGMFRFLVESEQLRIFPVYAPLPIIYESPLGGILRMTLDRLTEDSLRLCVSAFIYDELHDFPGHESEAPFDVKEFLQRLDESDGKILEELFDLGKGQSEGQSAVGSEQSGVPLASPSAGLGAGSSQESEEQSEVRSPESEGELESDGSGEAEGIEGTKGNSEAEPKESEEDPEIKKQREWLLSFVTSRAEQTKLGEQIRDTLRTTLTEGWKEGKKALDAASPQNEVLMGLCRLMSRYFKKVIVFVDQLEGWSGLDETEQATFLGAVAEFNFFATPAALLVFVSYDRALEEMGERIARQFQLVNLNLRQAYLNLDGVGRDEVRLMILEFLNSDSYREERQDQVAEEQGELFPFTEEAVVELCERTGFNLTEILFAAHDLLEAGATKNYPLIGEPFVKSNLVTAAGQ